VMQEEAINWNDGQNERANQEREKHEKYLRTFVLADDNSITRQFITQHFRGLMRSGAHTDHGGNKEYMVKINEAHQYLKRNFVNRRTRFPTQEVVRQYDRWKVAKAEKERRDREKREEELRRRNAKSQMEAREIEKRRKMEEERKKRNMQKKKEEENYRKFIPGHQRWNPKTSQIEDKPKNAKYVPTRVEFQDEYGDWISGVVKSCIDAEHRGIVTDEQANSWQNTFLPSSNQIPKHISELSREGARFDNFTCDTYKTLKKCDTYMEIGRDKESQISKNTVFQVTELRREGQRIWGKANIPNGLFSSQRWVILSNGPGTKPLVKKPGQFENKTDTDVRREEAKKGGKIDGARKQRRKQEKKQRKEERKWNNLNRDRETRLESSWRTQSNSNRPQSHWASRDVTLWVGPSFELVSVSHYSVEVQWQLMNADELCHVKHFEVYRRRMGLGWILEQVSWLDDDVILTIDSFLVTSTIHEADWTMVCRMNRASTRAVNSLKPGVRYEIKLHIVGKTWNDDFEDIIREVKTKSTKHSKVLSAAEIKRRKIEAEEKAVKREKQKVRNIRKREQIALEKEEFRRQKEEEEREHKLQLRRAQKQRRKERKKAEKAVSEQKNLPKKKKKKPAKAPAPNKKKQMNKNVVQNRPRISQNHFAHQVDLDANVSAAKPQWTCLACTFLNDYFYERCSMCFTPRNVSPEPFPVVQEAQQREDYVNLNEPAYPKHMLEEGEKQNLKSCLESGGGICFSYESDMDEQGIVFFLATNWRTEEWRNPASERRLIDIRSSPLQSGSAPVCSILGREVVQCISVVPRERQNFFLIDFGNFCIQPTRYTLRGGETGGINHWVIEGSVDLISFDILRTHHGRVSKGEIKTWRLQSERRYRAFRIRQVGGNLDNHRYMSLSSFEIYGDMYSHRDAAMIDHSASPERVEANDSSFKPSSSKPSSSPEKELLSLDQNHLQSLVQKNGPRRKRIRKADPAKDFPPDPRPRLPLSEPPMKKKAPSPVKDVEEYIVEVEDNESDSSSCVGAVPLEPGVASSDADDISSNRGRGRGRGRGNRNLKRGERGRGRGRGARGGGRGRGRGRGRGAQRGRGRGRGTRGARSRGRGQRTRGRGENTSARRGSVSYSSSNSQNVTDSVYSRSQEVKVPSDSPHCGEASVSAYPSVPFEPSVSREPGAIRIQHRWHHALRRTYTHRRDACDTMLAELTKISFIDEWVNFVDASQLATTTSMTVVEAAVFLGYLKQQMNKR